MGVKQNDKKTDEVILKNISEAEKIIKMIYTTNTLEGFNRQLRKVTKIRTIFPNDDALRKSVYIDTQL